MGVLKAVTGTFVFIIALVVIMQPVIIILDSMTPLMNTASSTTMYGTNSDGQVVAVGNANSGGDLTWTLLYGIGFFMVIGFIIWLVLRAPVEPDIPPMEEYNARRF